MIVLAEFLFEKSLAEHYLTNKAFAADKIAVGFNPHRAFRLKSAFSYILLDFFI